MAWGLYSEKLLGLGSTGDVTKHFTVPAGTRAVLRCVTSCCGSASGYAEISVANEYLFFFDFQAPGAQVHGDLRCVAYAGQTMTVRHTGGAMWTTLNGYVFDDAVGARDELRAVLGAPPGLPAIDAPPANVV